MTNELELDRKDGLRVGFLVQRVEDNTVTGQEGILKAIHRAAPGKNFTYLVDWQDGTPAEDLTRKKINRSHYADHPHWEDPVARAKHWVPGSDHFYILFDRNREDFGSCLFCGRMRQLMASTNGTLCSGPVRVELRATTVMSR